MSYDPSRTDLFKQKDDISKYQIGRVFKIQADYVIEPESNWKGKITNA